MQIEIWTTRDFRNTKQERYLCVPNKYAAKQNTKSWAIPTT